MYNYLLYNGETQKSKVNLTENYDYRNSGKSRILLEGLLLLFLRPSYWYSNKSSSKLKNYICNFYKILNLKTFIIVYW